MSKKPGYQVKYNLRMSDLWEGTGTGPETPVELNEDLGNLDSSEYSANQGAKGRAAMEFCVVASKYPLHKICTCNLVSRSDCAC